MSESKLYRRKRSNIWLHFTPELSGGKARCDICKALLAFTGGTTSNLTKHLKAKHPSVVGDIEPKKQQTESASTGHLPASTSTLTSSNHDGKEDVEASASTTIQQQPTSHNKEIPNIRSNKQNTLGTYIVRPASVARQKRLNDLLLKMIVKDFQPFSVVNDTGFREFVAALDPSYNIPSRSKITTELLPAAYSSTVDRVKDMLGDAEAVTLTTDSWTSLTTENYVAVTCHFITSEFKLDSCLIQCSKFPERHTAENLANDLLAVVREWNLENKIQAVVTDSAANINAAVKITGFTHLFCFAHILNLVVQNGIKVLQSLQSKMKHIVEHFHRSTVAAEKLLALQRQMRPEYNVVKVKNDVVTRWNSTYDMFRRMCEIQEPLDAAIAVLQKPVESLTSDEWNTARELCKVLKPFDSLTREMSSDQAVTVSKVIVVVEGLKAACHKLQPTLMTQVAKELVDVLIQELNKRFGTCDMNPTLARATLLDPRFKKLGFRSEAAFTRAKDKLIADVTRSINTTESTSAQQVYKTHNSYKIVNVI